MKTRISNRLIHSILFASLAIAAQSCFNIFGGGGGVDDRGELIGVQGREGWVQTVPYGMVPVPAGTFHMGQADQDIAASMINMNKQVTIGAFFMDDTEITNNEYRQFVQDITEGSETDLGADYVFEDLYPDTTVWVDDFTHHMGDPLMEYYYAHPAFDDYPVVGIDWKATQLFCKWRTEHLNEYRASNGLFDMPNFRLPSEAEWEYAARGGRDLAKYPWGNPYIRNSKGCLIANFKPGRGNYFDDGYAYTAPANSFFPNDYGLFNMSGNVAEWTQDAFNPAAYPLVWDLNPTFFDDNINLKVIRGGSWKDVAYFLETGTRNYEHEDTSRSFIGFRCAMTYLGRSSGNEF